MALWNVCVNRSFAMANIISGDVWGNPSVIMAAHNAQQRIFCVAYVTRHLPILFKHSDVLICDASEKAVSSGETDPSVLKALVADGVKVFSVPDVHIKCAIFGEVVLVGSANMSESSAQILTEMSVLIKDAELAKKMRHFLMDIIKTKPAIADSELVSLITLFGSKREALQKDLNVRLTNSRQCVPSTPPEGFIFWIGYVKITTWPDGCESADILFSRSASSEREYRKLSMRSIRLVRQAMLKEPYLKQVKKIVLCKGVPTEIVEETTQEVRILLDKAQLTKDYLDIFAVECEPRLDGKLVAEALGQTRMIAPPRRR